MTSDPNPPFPYRPIVAEAWRTGMDQFHYQSRRTISLRSAFAPGYAFAKAEYELAL